MARMPLKYDRFGFRFEIRPGFALLVFVVVLVMLRAGFWQLDRAEQKLSMQQAFETASQSDSVNLNNGLPEPEVIRYRGVLATGEYLPGKQFLLDNRIGVDERGVKRVGYEVLTPFILTNGGMVLINRGWLPAGDDRRLLPNLDVASGTRRIEGRVDLPGKGFRLGDMDNGDGWPRVIQFIDYGIIERRLQTDIYPAVIMLSPEADDGYLRDWRPVIEGPRIHYSYAVQWFAMSLAVVILFLIFTVRRKHDERD
jgi:surfeit locus 1 family protein